MEFKELSPPISWKMPKEIYSLFLFVLLDFFKRKLQTSLFGVRNHFIQ